MLRNIVFEDEHIIVVHKPAGIATQTARIGQQDMVSELKNYLANKADVKRSGEPYLGIIHRLDQPVSGLLVFAKTRQAAGEIGKQVANGKMQKFYYAIIYGRTPGRQGRLEGYLYKDGKTNCSLIVKEDFPGAKRAVLNYKQVQTLTVFEEEAAPNNSGENWEMGEVSLVEIELLTGRHHQIRAQMSHEGMPLLGDSKYGTDESKELSRRAGCRNVALCAFKLVFFHPVSKERMVFERQPEEKIFLPFFSFGLS